MAYRIIVSKEANNDIDDIVNYIAKELANPTAATSFLDDVEKSYRNLLNNPRMYSLCQDARLRKEGYRKITIKNFLVLYRIDDIEEKVFVLRIMYGGRNYPEFL